MASLSKLPLSNPPSPSICFSSSLSSSSLQWRRSAAVPARPRRRFFVVQAKIREIFMPALSSTMTEGKIVSWVKSEGDVLSKGEAVVVVESDKADMDVETFYDGILAAIVVPEGETAPVGAPIGILAESEEEIAEAKARAAHSGSKSGSSAPPKAETASPAATPAPEAASSTVTPVAEGPRKVVATPYAKKLAKQHKVDLNSVNGSGPFGRITPEDVEKAAGIVAPKKPAAVAADPAPAPAAVASSAKVTGGSGGNFAEIPGSSVVPFTTMQAAVAKNMMESLSVPTFRVGYPVLTDALDALYEKVKKKGVTMTALLAKAVAMALVQHPVVNATCKDGKNFTYNNNVNIAVAVAINGGLITPVLQDADKMDLYLLSQKWKELVEKARAKQLQPHEYNSGTFTLSNLGMFGVDRFDAILPPGQMGAAVDCYLKGGTLKVCFKKADPMLAYLTCDQGAIMAVGASKPTVVADSDGFFSVKNKMLVNVTADHRIIYGAELAAFLQTFSSIIQDPESLTM